MKHLLSKSSSIEIQLLQKDISKENEFKRFKPNFSSICTSDTFLINDTCDINILND